MVDPARSALSCGVWCVWGADSQGRGANAHPFLSLKQGAPQTEANYPEKETPYQATYIPYPKGLARYL